MVVKKVKKTSKHIKRIFTGNAKKYTGAVKKYI